MTENEAGLGICSLAPPSQPKTNPGSVYTAEHWYLLGLKHERERAAAAEYEAQCAWTRSGAEVAESGYRQRMREMEEAAHRFHERELGRAYVEYKGWAA